MEAVARKGTQRRRAELKADDKGEHKELMGIYVARGLDPSLAKQVADQLMAHDAIGAHARDELAGAIADILSDASTGVGNHTVVCPRSPIV
jgi:VIT1/CCC1 family predicted Fe2+/Mn2+ transporter